MRSLTSLEEKITVRRVEALYPENRLQTNAYPRVVIEAVSPSVDEGNYPARSTLGEPTTLQCVAFCDDHDIVDCQLLVRHEHDHSFTALPMQHKGNDIHEVVHNFEKLGTYFFYIQADINPIRTSIQRILRCEHSVEAAEVEWTRLELLLISLNLDIEPFTHLLKRRSFAQLNAFTKDTLLTQIWFDLDSRTPVSSAKIYEITVEPIKARFSSWYEFFPRSTSNVPGEHGTFKDCERVLTYVSKMGFDVVYLPPIHPIGTTKRKGRNNSLKAKADDVGSPWAIGNGDKGHKDVHPQLGTLDDFKTFVARAKELHIDVALDLAFQCSPDHPYLKTHPEWFKKNPDGTIAYAENPPKKYQDICPFDFQCPDWPALYHELKNVVTFWIGQGVRIFRVDNPHTKAFHFWKWLISSVRQEHGDIVFLSEAFTRPHVAYHLAKLGFSQSYTYFTWRHSKDEITELMQEYTQKPNRFFFRPSLWPNTPDILNADLQSGERATFIQRLVLAATLSPAYGIYGPAFETMQSIPKETGSEEYKDSEKYELKQHRFSPEGTLASVIQRINQIRRDNSALHFNNQLEFIETQNSNVIAFVKTSPVDDSRILTLVNLDASKVQEATISLEEQALQLHDLISGQRMTFSKGRGMIKLNPREMPACIFRLQRHLRREKDFDYFG